MSMKQPPRRKAPSRGRADLDRVRGMSEAQVHDTSPLELANLPENFWDAAVLVQPARKQAISLRVDEDVLAWFKETGPRYQSRINAVLRSYMNARQRGPSRR